MKKKKEHKGLEQRMIFIVASADAVGSPHCPTRAETQRERAMVDASVCIHVTASLGAKRRSILFSLPLLGVCVLLVVSWASILEGWNGPKSSRPGNMQSLRGDRTYQTLTLQREMPQR